MPNCFAQPEEFDWEMARRHGFADCFNIDCERNFATGDAVFIVDMPIRFVWTLDAFAAQIQSSAGAESSQSVH